MGLTSAQLEVLDLTPRIGSEIRTDLDTLLSGREDALAPAHLRVRQPMVRAGVPFLRH